MADSGSSRANEPTEKAKKEKHPPKMSKVLNQSRQNQFNYQ